MARLSIVIPSNNEQFLGKTIDDLFRKAGGEIEVIVVLDGPTQWPLPSPRPNLILCQKEKSKGMRAAINTGVQIASGEFLMKTDAHCMFAEGYDEVLKAHCDEDWVVIPSRWSLDAENWVIDYGNKKPRRDYHYLCYPDPAKEHDGGLHGVEWWDRGKQRKDDHRYDIDDTPSWQGSMWFMHKRWFTDFLGGLHEWGYGPFAQEPQEIGMKTWLGGGAVKTNKLTWYAHLHKGSRYGRGYHIDQSSLINGHNWAARHWVNNEEPGMIRKFSWFVNVKFPEMPTWMPDWERRLREAGIIYDH